MTRPQYNFISLTDFFNFLKTAVGYLEKDNASNLGDFTDEGKIANAGYNNYTVYWQWYKELGYGNYQGQAYCACAVSTMMTNGFGLSVAKNLLCGDLYIYCPTGYTQFKNKGRIYSSPVAGDIVFFWSSSLGRWSHTGIVISVDSNKKGYTTWEANTSAGDNTVVRNGGATCIKHYDLNDRKVAFGRPDYAKYGISTIADNSDSSTITVDTHEIDSWDDGIICTTDLLNIRKTPVTGSIIGTIKKNASAIPSKMCTVNGSVWFYITTGTGISGWASAKYFTGWVLDKYVGENKWWYLLEGYKYYVDQIANIGDQRYYFGSDGYLFYGTITLTTDENGILSATYTRAEQ